MKPVVTMMADRANYGGVRKKIAWIVMHYTANDGDSAVANGRYFQQARSPVASAHYFVDDEKIVQSVPEAHIAYHCGAAVYRHPACRNANSIGIELCDTRKDGRVMATERTIENAAELAAALCEKYQIPVEHIIRHYDVTGKACPKYWVKDAEGIVRFRKMVKEAGEMVEKSVMIVDGKEVAVERILKDGTNYIKIRDIAKALDLNVTNRGNVAILSRKE